MWSLKDVEADATAVRTAMAARQASPCLADISRACPPPGFCPEVRKRCDFISRIEFSTIGVPAQRGTSPTTIGVAVGRSRR